MSAPMVVRAARALCIRASETCGVNYDDNWKTYSDEWLTDAQAMLDAVGAPDLLEALQRLLPHAAWMQSCSHDDDGIARDLERARAAIAKATGG